MRGITGLTGRRASSAGLAIFFAALSSAALLAEDVASSPQEVAGQEVAGQEVTGQEERPAVDGRELFVREWMPNDPRSHGGDGLGPVFNDSSCVACHNQGGVGGAGPKSKNVDVITAFKHPSGGQVTVSSDIFSAIGRVFLGVNSKGMKKGTTKEDRQAQKLKRIAREREKLGKIHPGFLTARSVVLHQSGIAADYLAWRGKITGVNRFGGAFAGIGADSSEMTAARNVPLSNRAQAELNQLRNQSPLDGSAFFGATNVNGFAFIKSERNAISLFGAGEIDSITDDDLVAAAAKKYPDFPEVSGRVARLKNGRVGKFGWKAQMSSLEDFVLTACGVELGLHVPGHAQGGDPRSPEYRAPGYDLDKKECDALIKFVGDLPAPTARKSSSVQQTSMIAAGKKQFGTIGCATCHTPTLGNVEDIYGDLLLHNLGQGLGDSGNYGSFAPDRTEDEELDEPIPTLEQSVVFGGHGGSARANPEKEKNLIGATRLEWRTPPLWGLRDSAPYLHDGRADSIEQSIAFHGGEATRSTRKFFSLESEKRLELMSFLKSLTAPD
jgi:CxxC motif-containing protein (DUF1111 family)